MRSNTSLIPRWREHSVFLLLAVACAPDQYVSMGSDIGSTNIALPGSLGGAPADSGVPLTVGAGGESDSGKDSKSGASTGGVGTVDTTSGSAGNANGGFGGASITTNAAPVKVRAVPF